jgi:predicted lipoprotein with Yx(FWY)xxD motif/cytochrome c553
MEVLRSMNQFVRVSFAIGLLFLVGSALANLGVAPHPDLGDHVITEQGQVLYVFLPDAQGPSTCEGGCAEAWPPYLADGEILAAEELDADAVGTAERADGTLQVTYFGWPLYTFASDTEPGMATGQGVGGNWFVIAPDGTVVGAEMASGDSEEVAMSQEEYDALFRAGNRAYLSTCSSCHGRSGNEVNAAHVKRLDANENLADVEFVITQILNGRGYMPGFGASLSDAQAAGIATFIRGSWGNEYGPVREEDIAEYR